jgi:hypothetical protein
MNRHATFLAVVTLATGFAALRTVDEQLSSHETVGLHSALSDEQKLTNVLTQYRAFKGTLEATVESLRHGHVHLKEALAIVREASTRHHPKYLSHLVHYDKGATTDERLARNLIGHVHTIEKFHPTQPSPLPGLDQELREFLAEIGE